MYKTRYFEAVGTRQWCHHWLTIAKLLLMKLKLYIEIVADEFVIVTSNQTFDLQFEYVIKETLYIVF